jgi:hypothetical protein
MKFPKKSLFFILLLILFFVNISIGQNEIEEKTNAFKVVASTNSAFNVASELIEAGMNGDFKKLSELFCKPNGPYTTYEDVINLDIGNLGRIEKLTREESSEIDPQNFKLVLARTKDSGKIGFSCFLVFKTPASYKVYLRSGIFLFGYPFNKEAQLFTVLEFYLLNYGKFTDEFLKIKFEQILKNVNASLKDVFNDVLSYSYKKEAMNLIRAGILKGELITPIALKNALEETTIDITIISTALADYITDNRVAPKQAGIYDATSSFYKALSSFYVKVLPIKDPWGNNYRVYCGTACNGIYGISGCDPQDFIVISFGADGKEEAWKFDSNNPEAGLIEIKTASDFNIDLVMWNGSWIRGPRR